jgi:hypothetical protein
MESKLEREIQMRMKILPLSTPPSYAAFMFSTAAGGDVPQIMF